MASFDIINAAGYGYRNAWQERRYLVRLAAVPLAIKFICLLCITLLGWDDKFLRQGLILLPAYFADGWMLSHYVRLLFLNQRWPFRPTGNATADHAVLLDRMHGVMSGMLVFALSRYLVAGIIHVSYQLNLAGGNVAAGPAPVVSGIAALVILIFSFWGFRFLWFYIPAALGYSLRQCRADIRGLGTSFYMIAAMLVCFLPVQLPTVFLDSALSTPYAHAPMPVPVQILLILLRAVSDTIISLIATGGIAYGFRVMIHARHDPKARGGR